MSKKQRVKGKGADIFFSEERSEDLTTKATFYFTQSQLDALEKAVFVLSQEHRIKTNKSEIMRIACEEITKDFLENRKDSALYERLAGEEVLAKLR